jgi:lipopolysaccharide heptosyltransferase II
MRESIPFGTLNNPRILIIKFGAIGDVVLTTPAIRAIRNAFPLSFIAFLVRKESLEIIKNNPNINKVIIFEEKHYFPKITNLVRYILNRKLLQELKSYKFDLSIDFESSYKSYYITALARIKNRIGFKLKGKRKYLNFLYPTSIDEPKETMYQAKKYLYLLKNTMNINSENVTTEVSVSPSIKIDEFLRKNKIEDNDITIGINPATRAITKRWPKEYYLSLSNLLVSQLNAKIIITYGPNEFDYVKDMKMDNVYIAPSTNLSELAYLIKKCKLFISNDTAPLHIARAVGTPTIGLYGPTDHRVWGLQSKKDISLFANIKCSPCNKFFSCKKKKIECMYAISIDEVFLSILKLLN